MPERYSDGSLKHRLLLLALSTVVLVWLGAAAFTYFDARQEMAEILDAHLAQSAALLVVQPAHELDEIETDHTPLLHRYSRRVAFQIWSGGQTLRLHSANAPSQALATSAPGFSTSQVEGQSWRVFTVWNEAGTDLIHVAELTVARDELATDIIAHLLTPMLLSLPVLALLLWLAVTRGLRPLVNLAAEIEYRAPSNLAALDTKRAPREVAPLIKHLNHLFVRINASLQQERRFTADAAHELRTPIAGIKAQLQVAQGAMADIERRRALDNAVHGCDRAAHLIDQLLVLARVDILTDEFRQTCDLRAIATEVLAELAPVAISAGIAVALDADDVAPVRGDAGLLGILLRNLVNNGIVHTRTGTTVVVSISSLADETRLMVSDDGPGLASEELARLSERFYRPVGSSGPGSGLGLSIVQRIADIHGAAVELNATSEGLSATLVFPHNPD